ncbi:hypothetical protein [Azospirillum doebereinerae]
MNSPHRPTAVRLLGIALGATLGLAGCSSSDPLPRPTDMSATPMRQDEDRPGAWVYRAPNVDLKRYSRFIVDPVQVYRGSGSSFGGLTDAQMQELAQLLTTESRRALAAGGYPVTTQPGPDTARITLKLVRVDETVGGVATVSRILPIGAIVNIADGSAGGSGSFTGSVIAAAEVHDSQSSKLLAAAVRRHSPATFDLEATLSTMDTARASVHQAAQELRAAVDRVHGRTAR